MMDNQPPLTSPDGSSNWNPLESCPRPLYSRDSTQEGHTIPHYHQSGNRRDSKIEVKEEIKEEDDEDGVMEESEFPKQHKDLYQDTKVESSSYRNPPERCPYPLYSRDSTQEDHTIPHHHQGEELIDIKAEMKKEEEETHVMGDQQCTKEDEVMDPIKEEESSPDIGSNEQYFSKINTLERHLITSAGCTAEDGDITQHAPKVTLCWLIRTIDPSNPEESSNQSHTMSSDGHLRSMDPSYPEESSDKSHTMTSDLHLRSMDPSYPEESSDKSHTMTSDVHLRSMDHSNPEKSDKSHTMTSDVHLRSMDPSNPEESYDKSHTMTSDVHLSSHSADISRDPSDPQKSSSLQAAHTGGSSLLCLVCVKTFDNKKALLKHQKSHKAKRPYSCSECEKCYTSKGSLVVHQRTHTGERPFTCSECGKCFSDQGCLRTHQRIHTGVQPFTCSECGKCFSKNEIFVNHQRLHTGERPFSCPECKKCFHSSGSLRKHIKRNHTDESLIAS